MGFFSAASFLARLFTRRFFRVDGAALPPSVFLDGAEPSTSLVGLAAARVDLPVMLAVPPALSLAATLPAAAALVGAAVSGLLSGRVTAWSWPVLLATAPSSTLAGSSSSASLTGRVPAALLTGRAPDFEFPTLRGAT